MIESRKPLVVLANLISWDEICNIYFKAVPKKDTGRPGLNPNFLGYYSFSDSPPFDASLFVKFRKNLGLDVINAINEKIIALKTQLEENSKPKSDNPDSDSNNQNNNRGTLIMEATACPQDIAYPTDLNLLNGSREKSEYLIALYMIKNYIKKTRI